MAILSATNLELGRLPRSLLANLSARYGRASQLYIVIAIFCLSHGQLASAQELNGNGRRIDEIEPIVIGQRRRAERYPRPEIFNAQRCASALFPRPFGFQYQVVVFESEPPICTVTQHPPLLTLGRMKSISRVECEEIYDQVGVDYFVRQVVSRQENMCVEIARKYGYEYGVVLPKKEDTDNVDVLLLYPQTKYTRVAQLIPTEDLIQQWQSSHVAWSARWITCRHAAFGDKLRADWQQHQSFLAYVTGGNEGSDRVVYHIVLKSEVEKQRQRSERVDSAGDGLPVEP